MTLSNREPTLGDRVECKITGFTGIVATHAKHVAGCDRLWVEPSVDKDGKHVEGRWFDIDMVDIVEAGVVEVVKYTRKAPGGVDLPPTR